MEVTLEELKQMISELEDGVIITVTEDVTVKKKEKTDGNKDERDPEI